MSPQAGDWTGCRRRPRNGVYSVLRAVRCVSQELVRGRLGFDAGSETLGACRVGNRTRKSTVATSIVANDETYGEESYALAA